MKLPNFLIIGAARAGTTSLYNNLSQHPEVYMPSRKELHFFSQGWHKGLDWYNGHFENYNGEQMVGEASVSYSYPGFDDIFERMKSVLGDSVKIIYIVRDPSVRAISHYNYYKHYAKYDLPDEFAEAFESNPIFRESSYYSNFIEAYQNNFGKEAIHIVVFEDLIANFSEEWQKLTTFLNVDSSFIPKDHKLKTNQTFVPKNKTIYYIYHKLSRSSFRITLEKWIPNSKKKRIRNSIRKVLGSKQKPKVSNKDEKFCRNHFENEICRMEKILNRNLNVWRKSDAK